ncbi:hypothetical protein ES708_31382 [subsurface metagenome]
MSKRKYPSELNSKTIRVNIGDWQWLNSLSQRLGITVAQAFHKVITGLDHKDKSLGEQDHKAPVEPAQIPMPVTIARSTPVTAVRSTPITTSFSREVENVTNGHRQAD